MELTKDEALKELRRRKKVLSSLNNKEYENRIAVIDRNMELIRSVSKNDEAQHRTYGCAVRAEEHGHVLTGRPIVFGQKTSIGSFDEIIEPGALSKADLSDVLFLVNHNMDMIPLARSRGTNKNSTMQLSVDSNGMKIRVNLDVENNTEARNLYSAVLRGDITGMSFRFAVDKDTWEDMESERPIRRIKSIKRVMEVSAVSFPAYSATTIQTEEKSITDRERQKQRIRIMAACFNTENMEVKR